MLGPPRQRARGAPLTPLLRSVSNPPWLPATSGEKPRLLHVAQKPLCDLESACLSRCVSGLFFTALGRCSAGPALSRRLPSPRSLFLPPTAVSPPSKPQAAVQLGSCPTGLPPARLLLALHPPAHLSLRTQLRTNSWGIPLNTTKLKGRGLRSYEKARLRGLPIICRKPGLETRRGKGQGTWGNAQGQRES